MLPLFRVAGHVKVWTSSSPKWSDALWVRDEAKFVILNTAAASLRMLAQSCAYKYNPYSPIVQYRTMITVALPRSVSHWCYCICVEDNHIAAKSIWGPQGRNTLGVGMNLELSPFMVLPFTRVPIEFRCRAPESCHHKLTKDVIWPSRDALPPYCDTWPGCVLSLPNSLNLERSTFLSPRYAHIWTMILTRCTVLAGGCGLKSVRYIDISSI